MGPSGAGKSTLLHVLATIDIPSKGDIYIENDNIAKMKGISLLIFAGTISDLYFKITTY